jgi:hypothetical protein
MYDYMISYTTIYKVLLVSLHGLRAYTMPYYIDLQMLHTSLQQINILHASLHGLTGDYMG